MNENMNDQIPQVPVEPAVQQSNMHFGQMQQQPVMQAQPVTQAQPVMQQPNMQGFSQMQPAQPAKPTINIKEKLNNIDKEKTLKISGMVCGVLILLGIFVAYISAENPFGYKVTESIWNSGLDMYRIILILFAAISIGTYFLQKLKGFSLIVAGMALGFVVMRFDVLEGFEGTALGYWCLVLGSVGLIAIAVIENLSEIKAIFNKNSAPTPVIPTNQPVQTYAAAVAPVNPVGPVVQNVTVCANCGQPKKNLADQFCQSCGQRY